MAKPSTNTTHLGYLFGLLAFAIINILAINNYAYDKNGNVHCDNYVLNTYLYVILGFIIMAFIILADDRFKVLSPLLESFGIVGIIVMTIVMILFILLLKTTQNQVLIHSYWFIILLMLSMLMSINLKIYADIDMNIIYVGILITIVITAVVGFIGYKFGKEFITVDFDKYLRWALVALIVASFGGIFVNNPNYWYFITIASLIIFSLLLLSYNNTIRKNAETCKVPNYPDESFGLIIKIVNILQDVMYLLARNRLRGRR